MAGQEQGFKFDEQIDSGEGKRAVWAALGWAALVGLIPAGAYVAYLIGR